LISLPVREVLDDKDYNLGLEVIAGREGLSKKIVIPQIQKPGLALTGYTANLQPGRIQVLGNSEIDFLKKLAEPKRKEILRKICRIDIACFVVTHGNRPPPALAAEAGRRKIPLMTTPLSTPVFILRVTKFLEEKLTETTNIHGVLLDVYGVGILLVGKSGIGKSECALELVMKGHRLVADDIVHIRKKPPSSLYGMGSELIKYHMEIRGLGIINIKDLFGVASVRDQKLVELVIELVEWDPKREYERLGIDQQTYEILGVKIPLIQLPVRPGRSLTSIIEVAARNQLLKLKGFYSAQEFQEKLTRQLLAGEKGKRHLRELVE
jgi:HPr kinase/phosphorylase